MAKSVAKKGFKRKQEKKEFEEEVIQIDRVTRVVAGGRRFRFRVMVAIGNKRGKVGVGTGKAGEIVEAIQKALADARKNLIEVAIVNDTIPHEVRLKHNSAKILLMPATDGTGIIAGGATRKLVELAGIKNILSKRFGTTNKMNNAKATIKALQMLSLKGANMELKAQEFAAPKPTKEDDEQKKPARARKAPAKKAPAKKDADKKDAPKAEKAAKEAPKKEETPAKETE